MSRRSPTYDDLRCVVLLQGRKSDFKVPECESGEWASSTAWEALVQAEILDGTMRHGGPYLTELGEGIYQQLVIGRDSPTLRELAAQLNPAPKRRWLRLSLLVGVLAVAIAIGVLHGGGVYHSIAEGALAIGMMATVIGLTMWIIFGD